MRRFAIWLAVGLLGGLSPSWADEPHLELIRGLRAAGEPELALQYMQERLPTNLPPQLAQVIGLEMARTRAEIARAENEEGKRLALFAAARAEFEKFLQANPKHELAPQARFEIARLIAVQGKEAVNRAFRTEGEARTRAFKDARPAFADAGKQLKDAAKQLSDQLKSLGDPQTPAQKALARDLTQSWLTAQLEEGLNLYMEARTYAESTAPADIKMRATLMGNAAKAFDKLATQDPLHPTCWLGRAWLARCYFENDDYGKATEQFDILKAQRGPQVEDARRVAEYFRILMLRKQEPDLSKVLIPLQNWLERYRAYQNSPEGCGVRYTMADVLEKQAYERKGIETDAKGRPIKVTAEAAAKLRAAERQLRLLTEFENDYTDRAGAKRMRLILAIAINETRDRDPAKVNTFEKCYLLALLEVAELNEELKDPMVTDDPDKAAEVRKSHYKRAVRALDRALTLVKPTDPPREVLDARVLQVYSHLVTGDNKGAAQLGEALSKQMARSSRGAVPALYALQAHRNLMVDAQAAGAAKEAEAVAEREQVRRLATTMEANWPNDTPTDTARHALGTLYFTDGDFVKALETYARVTANYVSLAHLRNEQGVACFNVQKDPKVPAAVKKQWFDRITTELERMPDMGRGAEPEVAYAFCLARLQLGNLLLQEGKQYARVEQLGKSVMDQSATYSLGERSNEIKYSAQSLMLYGLYGRVFEKVKAHDNVEAAKLYLPMLEELKKSPLPDDDSAAKARRAASDFLLLSLRCSVQDGDIDRAQSILKQLEQVGGGKGDSSPLVAVLKEVQAQIADMRRNDPNRLKETIDKLTSFLEALAKQPSLTNEVKILLAQGFGSVDKPSRAIELLTSIPTPKEKEPGPAPKAPPETASDAEKSAYEEARTRYETAKGAHDAAWKPYWFAQLTHVRALRQAARLNTDAEARTRYFATAEHLLDEMIGTAQKPGWAFNSLEVRREKIFILEDRAVTDARQWRPAMEAWVAMQKPFVGKFSNPPKDDKETRLRAAYFEVRFYMFRLVYKSKQKVSDSRKKTADIKRLAEQIVELEKDARTSDFGGAAVKKLYQDWLEEEPEMRKAYAEAHGRALLNGDSNGEQ